MQKKKDKIGGEIVGKSSGKLIGECVCVGGGGGGDIVLWDIVIGF